MNILYVMFIIFLAVNAISLATVLIFGIFCPSVYSWPPVAGKKEAAAHGRGPLETQKRRYAL